MVLAEKEGLALINGTDGMLGMLALALADLEDLVRIADITAAMSVEALLGTDRAFAADLVAMRPHPGQAASAANLRRLLAGSPIVASHRHDTTHLVQDAYSLRCAPQVAGSARDTMAHARGVAERELDSIIDNPVITADGRVESNGNFHGAPVAHVLDFLAIPVADLASISERRTDRLLDRSRNQGLPAFLAHEVGVDSGYMIAQYTAAGIVSELKRLAVPASVDSIPSSAMQEDHVSMGWAAGRKLTAAVRGLRQVLAIELIVAGRGLDLRAPLAPAAGHRGSAGRAAHGRGGARTRPDRLRRDRRGRGAARLGRPARRGDRGARHPRLTDRPTDRRRPWHTTSAPRSPSALPAGTTRTALGWPQEAALRMLQNNLDPEVAEHPDSLVVYGGTGRAARDWPSFHALVRTLTTLRDDETMLVQSGQAGRA